MVSGRETREGGAGSALANPHDDRDEDGDRNRDVQDEKYEFACSRRQVGCARFYFRLDTWVLPNATDADAFVGGIVVKAMHRNRRDVFADVAWIRSHL